MRKHLKRLALLCIALYLFANAWLYLNQRSLLYFPDKNIKSVEEYNLAGTKDLMIDSTDGTRIQLWYHEPAKNMPMVLYLHGNSYNLGQRALRLKELVDMGYGFIAPSYRGFGKSEGTPDKAGILSDAEAAIKFLETSGYSTDKTIIIGESLGSGVASEMAIRHKFKDILLITPYTTIADRAQEMYWYVPVKYLVKDNFGSIDKVEKLDIPLLIVHGTKDDVIPHSHSEKLIALAHEPKKLIIYEGKGHANLDYREVFKDMTKYFSNEQLAENNCDQ